MYQQLTYGSAFRAHNNLVKQVLLYFNREETRASEKLRNLPEVTQLGCGKSGIWSGVACLQSLPLRLYATSFVDTPGAYDP